VIIAMGLYQGFSAVDAIGPYEVLTHLLGADVVICAEHTCLVDDHNDLVHLRVDSTFADVARPDVLFVPGGPVTAEYAADGPPIVDWIFQAQPHTAWTTSVCTGALLLGAAGLLNGRIVTGAGVSAGIDRALTLATKIAGPEAQCIQLAIEYDPQPPFDAGSPSKAPKPIYDMAVAALGD